MLEYNESPPPWGFGTVFIAFALEHIVGTILAFRNSLSPQAKSLPVIQESSLILSHIVTVFSFYLLIRLQSDGSFGNAIRLVGSDSAWIVAGALGGALFVILRLYSDRLLKKPADSSLRGLDFLLNLAGITRTCISGPIREEILFQGIVFPVLLARTGAWTAVPLTSLVFALMHVFFARDDTYRFAWHFLLGLFITALRATSISLLPGIVFHSTSNLLFTVLRYF